MTGNWGDKARVMEIVKERGKVRNWEDNTLSGKSNNGTIIRVRRDHDVSGKIGSSLRKCKRK